MVVIAGSLQSEIGCPGDWDPACPSTGLTYDPGDDAWQATFGVPAGVHEYKVALNGGWAENYGAGGLQNGANLSLALAANTVVKFYYDHKSHWVTDTVSSVIVTAAGNFQSELGCAADFDPACLRSWLQDLDGDGVYTLRTTALPPGGYETKVAIGESWTENYGVDGIPNGPNILFVVPPGAVATVFTYDSTTHVMTVTAEQPNLPPNATDDAYSTQVGTALVVPAPGVLGNDTDTDEDPLTTTLAASPAHGALALDADGGFSYLPDAGYTGPDSFTYRAVDDAGAMSGLATVSITVEHTFSGFSRPLRPEPNLASARAGARLPVKFSLGGDYGLDILAAGSPASAPLDCATLAVTGAPSATMPFNGGLSYDADREMYVYRWATEKEWQGTCRQLVVTLADGSAHVANVKFR